jgi:tetratricopeptide (TPR) repeat protein
MGACSNDFLEMEPTDSISEQQVFSTYNNAESALMGAYDQLSGFSWEGLYVPIMADIMGEDVMINSVDNWNWFVPVYQLDMLPNYVYADNPWWAGYKLIFDANKIIQNAQIIPNATADQKNKLEGEALTLRAMTMLKLVQMYAPAYSANPSAPAILLVTGIIDADEADVPRAPLHEVYAQIENDLLTAINLLKEESDKGFLDQRAARALLARTYLDMQEWEKARDMAKNAFDGMDLMSINDLLAGFNYRNSETIFTIAYTQEDNNTYLSVPSFYWPVSGYSTIRAHHQFVNEFSVLDARKNFFLKIDEIDPDRNLIVKFAHNQSVGNAERIMIRASEMYLIEAECEAELGNYTRAQDALYEIQKRANPGARKSIATGEVLINQILLERRKELFGEGFRWNDIKRRQQHFKREHDHWVTFDFGPDSDDYYRFTFPIPQSEIDANSMVNENDQNAGY